MFGAFAAITVQGLLYIQSRRFITIIRYTLIIFIKKIMVNISREDTLRPCTSFQPPQEEVNVMAAKANLL